MTATDQSVSDGKTPDLHPEQIAAYRRMTPQQKLQLIARSYWQARRIKESGIRYQNPDWTEEQVAAETRRIFLNGAG